MFLDKIKVLWNQQVGPSYYRIGLAPFNGLANAQPGQFIMVRIPGNAETILRRPFSIHRVVSEKNFPKAMEILYKVVGKGTDILSKVEKGEELDILGPLGNGFKIPETIATGILVGGGIGIAPLVFLISSLFQKGYDPSNFSLFLGAGTKSDLLCLEELAETGIKIYTTTDDGTFGDKAMVTDALATVLQNNCPDVMYACGPLMMLKQVAVLAKKNTIPCQISLESMMACGMGACLGCAVKNAKSNDTYDHVCVDGPVFDLNNFQFD